MPGSIKSKEKVAILGGGMAALTAAFELTGTPELRDRYDITVYQMGWRLGGKGASGRNAQRADRIEEHGLHILMGFYHNTFRVLRACYEELGREPREPLATVEDAIKPHSFIVIAEEIDGRWEPWPLLFPPMPGKPGDGAVQTARPLDYLKKVLAWMHGLFTSSEAAREIAPDLGLDIIDVEHIVDALPAQDRLSSRGLGEASPDRRLRVEALIDGLYAGGSRHIIPTSVYLYLSHLLGDYGLFDPGPRLVWLLRRFRSWLDEVLASRIQRSTRLRRLWIALDLGITTVIGVLKDGVATAPDGWLSLDDLDLRRWLEKHGAAPITLDSAPLRSMYNLVFSGPGQIAAGSLLQGVMRMVFGYKEAIFQKMQAGMGDTIFAPLYLVLKRRGVKFEFFHRIDQLVLSSDKKSILAIEMGRQARPKGLEYDPLYDVDGLPCWPSAPLYDRIEGGEALRRSGQNLEASGSMWPDVEARRLEVGSDFDRVVLGISIGAFPTICKQLIGAHKPFAKMVEHIKTTQTQAVQLWLKSDLAGLGWRLDSPVLDGFADPFDTWADMSHLLPRERWPMEGAPRSIAYLCSRLEDDAPRSPSAGSHVVDEQGARTKKNAIAWLRESAGNLWPGAMDMAKGRAFDWSQLVDPEGREGEERFESQYWQATFCPSERYVLGVPGSTKYRLRAHESGFQNLVLAGDWVRTGMNAGCVEAAAMAGLQASRAICGHPAFIPGDDDIGGVGSGSGSSSPVSRAERRSIEESDRARSSGEPAKWPRYIERGGEIVVRQPLLLSGVTTSSFILAADVGRLTALVDRILNAPANGAVRYVPAGPFVALVCADIARGQALDEPDRSRGWMAERDVAFWVPLWAGKQVGTAFVPQRLVFFLPYVFVDNIAAAVTGREIYGFPKETGILTFPKEPGALGSFTVDTLAMRKRGHGSRGEVMRLVEIDPSGAPVPPSESGWVDLEAGIRELDGRFRDLIMKGFVDPLADAALSALRGTGQPGMRLVFLKQFRDAVDPGRACYQAIVEAPAVVKAVRGGGWLPPHRVRIAQAESHPIVQELGLTDGSLESTLGIRLAIDFTMERGEIVWSARDW
jgi:uncharacterized protein with NAD-binding domain and iron-sulfur cluster